MNKDNSNRPSSSSEQRNTSSDSIFLNVFCGDGDVEISIPRQASSEEVSAIIKDSLGVRGSFFLQLKSGERRTVKSGSLQSIYFHCSSIKASVLEKYKEFSWEIRGSSYQKGGDSLWYYQSQQLRPEVLKKFNADEWEPLDFPP